MTDLAVTAISALQDAGLVEEIQVLCERVFRLDPDRLFDCDMSRGPAWMLSYKPMVELLLLHLREIAQSGREREDRRSEIRWAVEMAGF